MDISRNVQHPGATATALFFASLVVFTISRIFYNLFLHPIRGVPGPWWWAASSLPIDYHNFRGTAMHRILELHRIYGKEVRIAPDHVSFASGQVWKEIYSARPEFPKDPKQTELGLESVKSIFMADQENHARFRRLLAYAFSAKGIKEQEPRFTGYINLLIERLHETADAGQSVDMVDWFTMTVFDVLGDLTWGESFNGLKDRRVHDWVAVSMYSVEFFFKAGALMKNYAAFLIPFLTDRKVLDAHKLNALYSSQLTEKRAEAGSEPRGDFWDKVLIKSGPENKGDGMSLEEMKANASFLILAGAETTATTLSGITYLLASNPRVLSKLVEEIRSAFASSDEINLTAVGQLTYLPQVIMEAMRMYPPVVDGIARVTPRGGGSVLGRWYPDNISLHTNHLAIGRLESNFRRPDDFVPERWATDAPIEFANDARSEFQPFATGTRNCIGQNLAHAEMRLIMAKILFDFDLELDAAKMSGKDWFATQKNFGIWFKDPLWVKWRARKD